MFDNWVVIFQFLILLVQILHKHSEIGSFCVCLSFYTNTTRLPTRHSALLLIINKTIVTSKEVCAANALLYLESIFLA